MTDSKECKIIDSINVTGPGSLIQTPCGKFLIGIEDQSIFCYNLETKQKDRIAGSKCNYPSDLTLSKDCKTLFVADKWNGVIRAICVGTGVTTTFAGQVGKCVCVDGPKEKACFRRPTSLKLSPDGNTLLIEDNTKFRSICIATGQVDTIHTFENLVEDFIFSPDSKNIYINMFYRILKFNFGTQQSELILKDEGVFFGIEISKDGQFLFISYSFVSIQVVNLVTNQIIDTIRAPFKPTKLIISTDGKQLYVCDNNNGKIQVFDISKYCTNFNTFLQIHLSKYSFLPPQVINSFSM